RSGRSHLARSRGLWFREDRMFKAERTFLPCDVTLAQSMTMYQSVSSRYQIWKNNHNHYYYYYSNLTGV
ncbi:hypothetical protein ACJ73_00372, partial [Blastomyces percursus]